MAQDQFECRHVEAHENNFKSIDCEIKDIRDNSVRWSVFIWVAGIFTLITLGLIGMYMNHQSKISSNEVTMAKIETKLLSIEANIMELKVILKEHDK